MGVTLENNMSDIINKFNSILKDKNIDINNITKSNNNKSENDTNNSSSSNFGLGSDFDISTLLKFKNIFDKANNINNPRNQLLYSLKPFLREKRKEKLDQYIKIANILYVLNSLNETGDKK